MSYFNNNNIAFATTSVSRIASISGVFANTNNVFGFAHGSANECNGVIFENATDTTLFNTPYDTATQGFCCNDDDINARVWYIASNGVLVPVSNSLRKISIRTKNKNNLINRFLALNIRSYGYKYDIYSTDPIQK